MLDVLHYYLDEDYRYATPEAAQMHSKVRDSIFGVMYGTTYKYGVKESSGETSDAGGVKGYIPPTEFDADSIDPFGGVLDTPMN